METVIRYIQHEQRTFAELPFTPVDSLIFASLSYCNFDTLRLSIDAQGATLPQVDGANAKPVYLFDILSVCDYKELSAGSWLKDAEETTSFFHALRFSRRYRNVRVTFFTNERADAVDKQFSATTFLFEDAAGPVAYLAFRGTDGTFTGWKEDFNMSFKTVVPSQPAALAYLSGVASAFSYPLILGGHSKGGNIAQYATLCCDPQVYQRIVAVYDHDGPSFLTDPSPRIEEASYKQKLQKLVPESSAFGMLLERRDDYRVVQSNAFALFQHHPFSWMVSGEDFAYQSELNPSARFFDEALDTWLRSKTREERELFIETMYNLLSQTHAQTWAGFQADLASNLAMVFDASSKLDSETRQFLISTVIALVATLRDQTIERLKATPPVKLFSEWS